MSALLPLLLLFAPFPALANTTPSIDLTNNWAGIIALTLFVLSYLVVVFEEKLGMKKSKPVLLAGTAIWIILTIAYGSMGDTHSAQQALKETILEYAELLLFLLVAMTYISAMQERNIFEALRAYLVSKGFSYKQLFWITGLLAFFISPVADNLTTALIMGAVILALGKNNSLFIALGCINVVVAANAGGAFTPFGDITTLMIWQKGMAQFSDFLLLFIPAAVNFLVPATIMSLALPKGQPETLNTKTRMRPGAKRIIVLFALTIATSVILHQTLHLPPVIGMLLGLSYLQLFSYYLNRTAQHGYADAKPGQHNHTFDFFGQMAQAEWDTLLFFLGVILAVGGLGFAGYLAQLSGWLYGDLGATTANIIIGVISAVVDNIPVMYAVLNMQPDMSLGHWLLVTLTAGVGGSLLSVGSAAGVALMGQAHGHYTFMSHLRWTPAIALGYIASILVHLWLNAAVF
jgi:NhaD family Na+/H+ antiporter